MSKSLVYVTGNVLKFESALKAFAGTPYVLEQVNLETPEIQSSSVEDVAKFSAQWASQQLNKAVLVTDAGLHIEALNGFPGPFVKFVNEWFTEKDYVNLLAGYENKAAYLLDCLAFCSPDEEAIAFTGRYKGQIAMNPCGGGRTPMDRIFIPEGFEKPIAMIPESEMTAYWSKGDILSQFVRYMSSKLEVH